jgi:hypothetical protein
MKEVGMNIKLDGFTITGFEKFGRPTPLVTDADYMALCNRVADGTATDQERAALALILEFEQAAA